MRPAAPVTAATISGVARRLAAQARHRVLRSLRVRPWVADIGLGAFEVGWGIWVGLHHEEVAVFGGFARFTPIISQLAGFAVLLGALRLLVALLRLPLARRAAAMVGVILWGGIAWGLTVASGEAAYGGYALFNALIVVRAF